MKASETKANKAENVIKDSDLQNLRSKLLDPNFSESLNSYISESINKYKIDEKTFLENMKWFFLLLFTERENIKAYIYEKLNKEQIWMIQVWLKSKNCYDNEIDWICKDWLIESLYRFRYGQFFTTSSKKKKKNKKLNTNHIETTKNQLFNILFS